MILGFRSFVYNDINCNVEIAWSWTTVSDSSELRGSIPLLQIGGGRHFNDPKYVSESEHLAHKTLLTMIGSLMSFFELFVTVSETVEDCSSFQ